MRGDQDASGLCLQQGGLEGPDNRRLAGAGRTDEPSYVRKVGVRRDTVVDLSWNPVICERPRSELGRFEAGPKDAALLRIKGIAPSLPPLNQSSSSIPPSRVTACTRPAPIVGDVEDEARGPAVPAALRRFSGCTSRHDRAWSVVRPARPPGPLVRGLLEHVDYSARAAGGPAAERGFQTFAHFAVASPRFDRATITRRLPAKLGDLSQRSTVRPFFVAVVGIKTSRRAFHVTPQRTSRRL